MKKSSYRVIGIMSGTSLDGVDICLVNFKKEDNWNFEIEEAKTIPYSKEWKDRLSTAIYLTEMELEKLNWDYTQLLGSTINSFIEPLHIENLEAVCSHGHTVRHEPQNNYTLQIGNLPILAGLLNKKVVCNFRVQDVRLGGQGAPLVPIGDELLFADYKYCLNLGGFANISTHRNGSRIAYDLCPVNTVLNFYAEKMGREYDEGGGISRSGEINVDLLRKLQKLQFYNQPPPKSLGIEFVNSEILPIMKEYEDDIPGLLRTFSEHIALQISANLNDGAASEVLVTGGGAFNSFLMELIKYKTKTSLRIPSAAIINYKEAIIFAFLGVLKLRGEVNVLKSVTGASKDHSSGLIFEP